MKVSTCPVCGNHRTWLLREAGMRKKHFYLVCYRCQFTAGNARTPWGAIRVWNKTCKPRERDSP